MKAIYLYMALVTFTFSNGPVSAQPALIVGAMNAPVLRIGTEVPVKLRTELTTQHKGLKVGQRFEVETSEPVSLNGHLVIPVGTPGVGEVTSVRNKGMWGKPDISICGYCICVSVIARSDYQEHSTIKAPLEGSERPQFQRSCSCPQVSS